MSKIRTQESESACLRLKHGPLGTICSFEIGLLFLILKISQGLNLSLKFQKGGFTGPAHLRYKWGHTAVHMW